MSKLPAFRIQGSASEPYTVTAWNSGPDLIMRCSCPASRKGGRFCKHVAALLVGDVTNVVAGADQVSELALRAEGSPLLDHALRMPAIDAALGLGSVDDIEARFRAEMEAIGWSVLRAREPSPLESDALCLHGHFKNGRMMKAPTHQIMFEPMMADLVLRPDGTSVYENHRPRKRPWIVRSKALNRANSFGSADAAVRSWLELVHGSKYGPVGKLAP